MTKIVSVKEMQAIDSAADASGLSFDQMMENAGNAVAGQILRRFPDIAQVRVGVLVGSGNNGGDGLVAARVLSEAGAQVAAYLVRPRGEDDPLLKPLLEKRVLVAEADKDQRSRVLRNMLASVDVVIDAVLGTGFKLPLKGPAKQVLSTARTILGNRDAPAFVVAVDCPSGLDNDTGEIADEALEADLTVSLVAAKRGLLQFPGAARVGRLTIEAIGVAPDLKELAKVKLELASAESMRPLLPARPRDAHKGTFGTVLIVAGSLNYPGAAGLAALGAYLSGAGLVTLAVPAPVQPLIAQVIPEATWVLLPHEMGVIAETAVDILKTAAESADAILIGPGFGRETTTGEFLAKLLGSQESGPKGRLGFRSRTTGEESGETKLPACVVDADGLKLLTGMKDWPERLPAESVLTPHPGEMAVLTGEEKEAIQSDRIGSAQRWAKKWGHIVLLKGAYTVVAAPDGRTAVLPFATAALARAGTGDVLAGAISALRAQGMAGYEAALLGGYLHGRSGELAAEGAGTSAGVLAGDVADAIPMAIAELKASR